MTTTEFFEAITRLAGVTFVVSSMLALGLGLTVTEILAPLKRWVLVVAALVVNFVVVPLAALGIAEVLSLQPALKDGLLILGVAAGAPFLPKLAQAAGGDVALSVGLMVVLMVASVIVLPLALPWFLDGVSVGVWDIARSLVVLMLAPLAMALAIRASWPDTAAEYQPLLAKASTVAVIVLVVVGLGINVDNVLDLVGTRGLLAVVLLVVVAVGAGAAVGGSDPSTRVVMALGTGQRNLAAALVVATQSFAGTDTLTFVLVGSVVLLLVLLPSAPLVGRISGARSPLPGDVT